MSLQKRKCHKGFEHAGRSIEALCLQPDCYHDRLLCFYCIHESHPNHSIAYLIPGLKSPLQMLNKNSQSDNPQKNMNYIERRFKKINNGWLKISGNLESGISKIEERMVPQFNVIRETFKKNSVDQIIKELTSNQITSQKIEEYVEMINMVKKYKFNDVKKLKFMAFMIQHKLSQIFLNANNKIKEIMNRVIEETNEMNFLNFNLEEILKDRALYLQITKSLSFCKITDIEINSLNYKSFSSESPVFSQASEQLENNTGKVANLNNDAEQYSKEHQEEASLIIIERVPIEEQKVDDEFNKGQAYGEGEVKNQNILIQEESDDIMVDQKQQRQVQSHLESRDEDNHSNYQSQSQNHSNGFRSYQKALQQKKFQIAEKNREIIERERVELQKIHHQEGQIWSNQSEKVQNNLRQLEKDEQNIGDKDVRKSSLKMDEYEFQSEDFMESYNDYYKQDYHSQDSQQSQQNSGQNQQNNEYSNDLVLGDEKLQDQDNQENDQVNIVFEGKVEEQQVLIEYNHEPKIDGTEILPKGQGNADCQSEKHMNNNIQSSSRSISEFSCQFPSIDQNHPDNNEDLGSSHKDGKQVIYGHETQDQNFLPSYQFCLSITSSQMTLANTFNLKPNSSITYNQEQSKDESVVFQMFNEKNPFDEFFGQRKENQSYSRSKQYQILKKYFIFHNDDHSDSSSEELCPVQPKRVRWVEQHKRGRPKSIQKNGKKKLKLLGITENEIELLNYPRTRSQKMKMMKLIEDSKNDVKNDQRAKGILKKTKKQILKQENQIEEDSSSDENLQQSREQNQMIIEEAQQNEESSQQKQNLKANENHESEKQSSERESTPLSDHENKLNFQEEHDKENNRQTENDQNFQNRNLEQNMHEKNAKIVDQPTFSRSNLIRADLDFNHQPFSITSSYPPSLKLDKQALAQVSHSLLNKYEKAFIKEENNHKKQNCSEVHETKIKIKTVYLNGRFHQEIKKRLSLIDEQYIEELTIYCDTMDCAINQDSVAIISKMTKLTKLCVYWTYKLSKNLTKKLISSLPLLEELVLCQLQDLDTQIANEIVSKLPNLRRFHYASDYMKNLDKMQENLQFLIDFVGTSTKLAPLFILSKLKNLQTFWVSDIDDVKQVKEIITKMKTLKQVSISAFEKRNKDLNSIFNVLSKRDSLISLSLQGLQFKEQSLVGIIRNNSSLNTLIINQCPTVSNNTLAAVADTCHDLEQLFLMLTDSLEGERIFELKKLRTLVVRACWSINANRFKEGIKKLKNLRYLSLNMNNYWLGDDMLPSIAALPHLIFLNLDTTKVTDKGMHHLSGLQYLNTLICGRTQITANGLYKFFEKSKSQIKKLGLSRQSNEQLNRPEKINKHDVIYTEFEGKYLVRIGELLPELTHLSIGGFKNLYIENFATLDNLKCLQYKLESLPEETQKFLETTRLNLNANY